MLYHVLAGLEHIMAEDDCDACKANVSQAQFLSDQIRRFLDEPADGDADER